MTSDNGLDDIGLILEVCKELGIEIVPDDSGYKQNFDFVTIYYEVIVIALGVAVFLAIFAIWYWALS